MVYKTSTTLNVKDLPNTIEPEITCTAPSTSLPFTYTYSSVYTSEANEDYWVTSVIITQGPPDESSGNAWGPFTIVVKASGYTPITLTDIINESRTVNMQAQYVTKIQNDKTDLAYWIKDTEARDNITILQTSKADDNNVVKLSGTQNVGGAKTLTDTLTINGSNKLLKIKNTSITRNTAPEANINQIYINGLDSAGKNTWGIYHTWSTAKAAFTNLLCYKGTTTDNTYTRIGVGYDDSGNAYSVAPTPAAANGTSGTNIATTGWVNDPTKSTNVVHRSGDEDVAGVKSFTDSLHKKHSSMDIDTNPSATKTQSIVFVDKNDVVCGRILNEQETGGTVKILLGTKARSTNSWSSSIGIYQDTSGTSWTFAPTPATSDNSTKIATTAYVNARVQLVSTLPASPISGVLYCIPES